jgi:hypothetical protein
MMSLLKKGIFSSESNSEYEVKKTGKKICI